MRSTTPIATVLLSSLLLAAVLLLTTAQTADATALTYQVAAHERACFYAMAADVGKKLGFYFAVQSGGSFDIDFLVTDPEYNVVFSGEKERQGDFVFASQLKGEYSFCFSNGMSTFADKVVDFDISVEGEHLTRPKIPAAKPNAPKTDTTEAEDTLFRLSTQIANYVRNQKHYRTRENRNFDTVRSTRDRIFWFAVIESLMMVGVSGLQVFIVRTFFRTSGRRRI
ncbi:hypothetical protein RI367_000948 [Sorochytrium milnesiophthora]